MVVRDGDARHDAGRLRRLLAWLLGVDGVFIAIHIVHLATPYLPDLQFSIERERGFAELFQYAKELGVVILMVMLWRRTRWLSAAAWALVFLYLLLDDAISIHELGGDIAYRHLGFGDALGLRALDFGELLINGLAGVVVLAILGIGYRRGSADERAITRDLGLLVGILLAFGVGLDMIHSLIVAYGPRVVVGSLEDGGEMVTMSVIVWYALTVLGRGGAPLQPSLWERVRDTGVRKRK
jgi:hypothetical protein